MARKHTAVTSMSGRGYGVQRIILGAYRWNLERWRRHDAQAVTRQDPRRNDYDVRGIWTVYKNAEAEEMNAASKSCNVRETLTLIN